MPNGNAGADLEKKERGLVMSRHGPIAREARAFFLRDTPIVMLRMRSRVASPSALAIASRARRTYVSSADKLSAELLDFVVRDDK